MENWEFKVSEEFRIVKQNLLSCRTSGFDNLGALICSWDYPSFKIPIFLSKECVQKGKVKLSLVD